MLAVNGSIEAARAGEFGRGFSVVASDIRTLANESAENADKIKDMVREIQGQIIRVAEDIDSATRSARAQVEEARRSNANLASIEKDVLEVESAMKEIDQGAQEASKALTESAKAVQQISAAAEESSKASQEAAKAAEESNKALQEIGEAIEEVASQADELQNMTSSS
jgi:methyl-accepting chemotaxis protein